MSTPSDTPDFAKEIAELWIKHLSQPTQVRVSWQDENGEWHEAVGPESEELAVFLPPEEESEAAQDPTKHRKDRQSES